MTEDAGVAAAAPETAAEPAAAARRETVADKITKPKSVEVTFGKGRSLTLTQPPVLAQFDLALMLAEKASNTTYLQMLMPVLYVSAVDGQTVDFPAQEIEIRATITRLGQEGMEALMKAMTEHFGGTTPEGYKAAVKN